MCLLLCYTLICARVGHSDRPFDLGRIGLNLKQRNGQCDRRIGRNIHKVIVTMTHSLGSSSHLTPDSHPADDSPSESPELATAKPMPRSPIVAATCVISGLLTIFVGFVVFGLAAAFANATAGGTGAAGMYVGLWMVLATRGVARRRQSTFVGLLLVWTWLIGRIAFDFQATIITLVGLAPMIFGPVLLVSLA